MGARLNSGKFPGNFPEFSQPGRGKNSGKNKPPPLGGLFPDIFPAQDFPAEKFVSGEETLRRQQDYWTPSREDRLRALHAEGRSYGQIAKAFAKDGAPTRNAIGGKLHRLGLTNLPSLAREKAAHHTRHRHAVKAKGVFPVVAVITPTVTPYRTEAFTDALEGTAPRDWMTREAGECAWPLDGGLSCCAATDDGPYCTGHARIAYQPQQKHKKRDSANELVRSLRRWL